MDRRAPGLREPARAHGLADAAAEGRRRQPRRHGARPTLAFDRTSPSSIVGALSAARENARGAREVLSAEIWESLNVTHNALPQQRTMARRYGPHSLFRFVRERSAMVFGLADATMSRDESWLFLILGRSLERVDMTSRIISTRVLAGDAAPSWTLVLRSTGAYEPYLRTYRGMVELQPGGGVPAAGPAVPALGVRRARAGRGVPGRAGAVHGPRRGPDRGRRRGAPASSAGPARCWSS